MGDHAAFINDEREKQNARCGQKNRDSPFDLILIRSEFHACCLNSVSAILLLSWHHSITPEAADYDKIKDKLF